MNMNRLALLLTIISPGIHAQVSELEFKDTLNADKYVTPDKVWINPTTGFDALVISGLDRYVELTVIDSASASVWSAKSTKVTVDDRLTTSTGTEFYGKRVSVPALAEGSYTLREIIYDLQNKEVSRTNYPLSIDRTGPVTGAIGYTRGGWSFGSDSAFTAVPTGMQYTSVMALTFKGLSDPHSGLDRVEYFTVDPNGVERKKSVSLNVIDGSVTVPIADASNSTITPIMQAEYRVGIYIFDKAGNRSEMSRLSTIDSVQPWELIQVYNERDQIWESYKAGQTIYKNPVKMRTLRKKSDFVANNGTKYGWADTRFQSSDAEYNIYSYEFVYPYNADTYYEFQTYAGAIRRIRDATYNFKADPGLELAPKVVSTEAYREDTGTWLTSGTSDKTIHVTRFRATVEPRNYVQKARLYANAAYNCLIPIGATSCTIEADYNYNTSKGAYSHWLFAGKVDSTVLDTRLGGWTFIWDSNPPTIHSASVNPAEKSIVMTVIDNDRVNTVAELGRWDTKVFSAKVRDVKGKVTVLQPSTWSESDFKTKNAVFSYASLPEGRYTVLSVSASDLRGNTTTMDLNEEINLDSVPPAINFTYLGSNAEGKLIKGLENLVITINDASGDAQIAGINLSGGPNKENVSLTTIKTGADTYALEYPRLFPAQLAEDGMYKLTVNAIDGSNNQSSRILNFLYEPANLIVLDRMKTLGSASALKTGDDKPLAFLKTTSLRSQNGSIITGQLTGTVSLRKDSDFPITISGVTVAPGETKVVKLDMGQGEERLFAITPAVNGVGGNANFSLEFQQ